MRLGLLVALPALAMPLALMAQACGDETATPKDASDVPLFDTSNFPDGTSDDADDATSPADSKDATTPADTTHDTSAPDLIPDLDAPVVVSTTPEAGAEGIELPLRITIVFDEAVYAPTIATQTIKLIDWLGNEIPGTPTLGADGKTVTWKPTQDNQQLASAYSIRIVGNIISDLAGNKIVNTQDFTFTTANFPNQDPLRDIAAKYAPTIYSAVENDSFPQYQVPTKFDGDGDWNLANNKQWITSAATELIPAVYYAVSETRTHYFVNYVLYFPYVNHTTASYSHTNSTTGTLVVIEKAHGDQAERPLVSYHYWKEQQREEQLSFATTESDFVGDGSAPSWGIVAELAQATLFEGDREKIYVTAGDHRTCLWNWDDGATIATCEFNNTILNGNILEFAYQGGSPTKVVKNGAAWPSDMSEVDGAPESFGYALIPLYSTLWPRRATTGDDGIFAAGATYKYEAHAERPGGNTELSSKFIETLGADLSSFGRPVWAWEWDPATGGGVAPGGTFLADGISQGEIALDPAQYVWERHHRSGKANGLVDYVEATNSGWSRDYCFNGFLNIDNRTTDPKCAAQ